METGEIIQIFAESGFQVDPLALDILKSGSPELIKNVLNSIDSSVLVVGREHLRIQDTAKPMLPIVIESSPVVVLSDITNQSTCIGEYTDFVQYFKHRYSTLGDMLRKRISARPIESIRKRNLDAKEQISIMGMVLDVRTTINGHKLIEIEDTTGTLRLLIHKEKDKELFELAGTILMDEVIGVTGSLSGDGNLMFVNKIIRPDIPNSQGTLNRSKGKGKAVLISDIHVGSKTFLEDAWLKFLGWLGDDINYLVIAGDVVDGIGGFPGPG